MRTVIAKRPRYGATAILKDAVDTIPRRPSLELFGVVRTPRDFNPLLRPDGPFYGSGV